MSEINWEHVAQVRDRIAEVGNEHCDMNQWATGPLTGEGELPCGTTGCIAGHAYAISVGHCSRHAMPYFDAGRWLGLTDNQCQRLFYKDHWPSHYQILAAEEGHAKAMLSILDALLDGMLVLTWDGRWITRG